MNAKLTTALILTQLFFSVSVFAVQPDRTKTPGRLCSADDADFTEYRYKEHIPYCGRNVGQDEKQKVANAYGVPKSDWHLYEFDHLLPLGIGGSNDATNLWPQPLAEAHEKDKVEEAAFKGMENGTLTQAQAVQMIWNWVNQHADESDVKE